MAPRRKLITQPEQPDLFEDAARRREVPGSSSIDQRFADLMIRLNGAPSEDLRLAATAVSAWRSSGHTCLPLSELRLNENEVEQSLRRTRVVGSPGEFKPLILDHAGRLYLHRYWSYEQELAAEIKRRTDVIHSIPEDHVATVLDEIIGPAASDQRNAVEVALSRRFSVITGGPGTGKTRTIAYIVAALQRLNGSGRPPRIALAAPTGKAAARITESLRKAGTTISGDTVPEATTLHRLIGIAGDLNRSRHHRENPIPADVVIVDEASMIDLALMARLVDAVRPDARLILLGDKDQLASVEAGNVFGDICAGVDLKPGHQSSGHVAVLRTSFRFDPKSGIQKLASAIRDGDTGRAIAAVTEDAAADVELIRPGAAGDDQHHASSLLLNGYREVLLASDPATALHHFDRFRVLCGVRLGPAGVETLNRAAETVLESAGLLELTGRDYHGRPILILENDYNLQLFNGDIGILWRDEEDSRSLEACFRAPDGSVRRILPSRLPRHETAWAMTVHKSQGSEFENVLLVLPTRDSPVLTRELIYTAVTRARTSLTILGSLEYFRIGVTRSTARSSGLRDALWG